MQRSPVVTLLLNWIDSFLVWYALGLMIVLVARFVLHADWWWLLLLYNGAPYLFVPVVVGLVASFVLRQHRLTAVYLLLTIAGTLWVLPPLLPSQLPQAAGTSLHVVTFNAFPENTDLSAPQAWLLEQNADIVALQELIGEVPELAAAYPYSAAQDSGFLILSRYPVLQNEAFDLEGQPQQRVVLEINGAAVTLYNLHLLMPLDDDETKPLPLRYDETRRNAQIRALLQQTAQDSDPLLVIGDFNMSEWSPIYGELYATLDDAWRNSSWGIGATWPGGASEELADILPRLVRLDYVWYRGQIEALDAVVGPPLGSDHLPLSVRLDLLP